MHRKGVLVKTVAVEHRQNTSSEEDLESQNSENESEDWQNRCQICEDDSPTGLMLCDGEDGECTNAYHYRCVGLATPPRGRWLCAECQSLEEFKRAHPEEFTLCQSSDEDSEFSDPGESSEEDDGSYQEEQSCEQLDSTDAHSKPQSFVISDDQSDPESQYNPPESSSSEESEAPPKRQAQPIPRRHQPSRNVHSMNTAQRRKYIQQNLDPDYTPEDPIDQAWLIYRNLRHPNKRTRPPTHPTSPTAKPSSPTAEPSSPSAHPSTASSTQSPAEFKKFVTTLVRREVGEHLASADIAGKVHLRQTVSK